jgi:putative MATE family efflux protein
MSGSEKAKKYEIDMCNGPILSKLLLFALPLMCSSVLQLLFNAADVIVVGRYAGDNSLAAVGSTTSLINLLVNFFMGLSIGANVLVAKYYGAKKDKELSDTIHTAMLLSIFSGMALTVIGLVAAKQILIWMDTPDEVLDLAVQYLRIYFCGMTATMLYNFGASILRAVGDTRRPLYYLSFAGVVNVVLNLIFVIQFKMDVAGVGIATVISQCISAFLVVRCLMKEQGNIRLELKKMRVNPQIFLQILRIGLPASLQGIVFSLSNVIIQASVNSFGATVVAGNSAASNIEGFVYVAMNAFYQACISFTGQNAGAGKYERINRILFCAEGCALVTGVVLGNGAVLFGDHLLRLYTNSDVVVAAGMDRLRIVSRTYALCGMMDSMVGALRGLGYSVVPMFISIIGACGLRLFWIFTFFRLEQFHTVQSLYSTYPVSWIVTLTADIISYVIIRRQLAKKWSHL